MILSEFLASNYSNSTSNPSADVLAKVSKVMLAQKTGAPALNAALVSNNTTLSGLGKVLNALTSFRSVAQSLSGMDTNTLTSGQLFKNVTDLVSTYNSLNSSLKGLQQGELKKNGSVSRIQSQLARAFNSTSSGALGASFLTLRSIGISTQKNGDLAIDATKLQSAIKADSGGVGKLFANSGKGIADNLVSQIQSMVGATGSIQKETAAINKDISALNVKRSGLAKALTNQANALVKQYSSQQNISTSSTGSLSLFGMLGQ